METPKPSITNCPFTFLSYGGWHIRSDSLQSALLVIHVQQSFDKRNSGDYCTKVPPLPIPNREVKLRHADGTAQVGE